MVTFMWPVRVESQAGRLEQASPHLINALPPHIPALTPSPLFCLSFCSFAPLTMAVQGVCSMTANQMIITVSVAVAPPRPLNLLSLSFFSTYLFLYLPPRMSFQALFITFHFIAGGSLQLQLLHSNTAKDFYVTEIPLK